MKVLLHGRLEDVIARCVDRFRRLNVEVEVARTLFEGIRLMKGSRYDKVFLGPGVTIEDRLQLIKAAGETRCSMTELQDRNTIYKELKMHTLSGEYKPPV